MDRCSWCCDGGIVQKYHDEEWGFHFTMTESILSILLWKSCNAD